MNISAPFEAIYDWHDNIMIITGERRRISAVRLLLVSGCRALATIFSKKEKMTVKNDKS